jgi:hypothetical protein
MKLSLCYVEHTDSLRLWYANWLKSYLCGINGYHDSAIWTSRNKSIRFLFEEFDEERSLQNKCEHTRLICRPNFGHCYPLK